MASKKISPSNEGEEIRIAPLQIISFAGLLSKDPSEAEKLLKACKTQGFFYLDVNSEQEMVSDDCKAALLAIKDFYNKPLDFKLNYWLGRNQTGLVR
jgi:isopenicillin N synthase-like dioxygenase